MKLAVFTSKYPARIATFFERDIRALVEAGLEIDVFAKTLYLMPKAWAWAAEHAGQYDHVLGYWGNYAGTCAYLFHRLAAPTVPFSMWLHAGTDLYRGPVFMNEKLTYADNVITCCEFNQGYILREFAAVPGLASK